MTTHDAYLSATVAAKDTEIASLRTRLEATAQKVAHLQLNNHNDTIYYRNRSAEDATEIRNLKDCLAGRNKRVAELVNEVLELRKQPSCAQLNEELRTTHAAHRAAVVRWSDAEALNRTLQSELRLARASYEQDLRTQLDKAAADRARLGLELADAIQKRDKKQILEHGYLDQTAEIRRLKTRLNQLIATVHHAGSVFRAWVPENL